MSAFLFCAAKIENIMKVGNGPLAPIFMSDVPSDRFHRNLISGDLNLEFSGCSALLFRNN